MTARYENCAAILVNRCVDKLSEVKYACAPRAHTHSPVITCLWLVIAVFPMVYPHAGPNGSIIYVPQSLDNKIDVTTGNTAVIAKFIGLLEDLELIRIPDGVQCNSTAEPDNCRLAAFNGGSEFTMTCRVTPQMMNDGGVRNFSVPGGAVLASVYVNGKLHQAVIDMLVLSSSSSGVQVLVR